MLTIIRPCWSTDSANSLREVYTPSARPWKNAAGKNRSAIYVARSTDGGLTFPNPVHVIASNLSYEANNPAILQDGTLLVPFADHRRAGGEYIGMIATPDGTFQILWSDNRTGTYQLRIATIKVKALPSQKTL